MRLRLIRPPVLSIAALSIAVLLTVGFYELNRLESIGNAVSADELTAAQAAPAVQPSNTKEDARSRALLIHELTRGSLQVMHRDFFDEDNPHAIPSASLEDVFQEMERTHRVEMSWLNVHTDVVNVDHEPSGEFEEQAAEKLATGAAYVESFESGRYQYAGPIRLASQCLKCHVKRRTSTDDRVAGLIIRMDAASETGN